MKTDNTSGRPDKKRGPERSARRQMAEAAGMSRHQMYQAIAIAAIPEAEFEALVESENPPTLDDLVRHARGLPKRRARRVRRVCPHCGGQFEDG
jgi:hypothetical protein